MTIVKYLAAAFGAILILGAYQGLVGIDPSPAASWQAGFAGITIYFIYCKIRPVIDAASKPKKLNNFH